MLRPPPLSLHCKDSEFHPRFDAFPKEGVPFHLERGAGCFVTEREGGRLNHRDQMLRPPLYLYIAKIENFTRDLMPFLRGGGYHFI